MHCLNCPVYVACHWREWPDWPHDYWTYAEMKLYLWEKVATRHPHAEGKKSCELVFSTYSAATNSYSIRCERCGNGSEKCGPMVHLCFY